MNKRKSMQKRLVRMPSSLTRQGGMSTWRYRNEQDAEDRRSQHCHTGVTAYRVYLVGMCPQFSFWDRASKTLRTSKMSKDIGNVFYYS